MTGSGVIAEKIKVYFGFSRMSHSVLDVGHPAVAALLSLGAWPHYPTLILGLIAAFSGYTAVFALNDLMDFKVDTERIEQARRDFTAFDLDVLGVRHPIAQKVLTFGQGLAWVLCWGIISLVTAFMLHPLCFLMLLSAIGLEIAYCALLRVSHWKTVLSGLMVGTGALAGVFAVAGWQSRASLLLLIFLWSFCWEVGARNIPNDWTDLEEDTHLGIRTLPVRYGRTPTARVSFCLIVLTVLVSFLLPLPAHCSNPAFYEAGAAAAGVFLMIAPALRWLLDGSVNSAIALFNRACFYPVAMLGVTIISI
jgi:4-hydroxybenzoate polyprenyltransferase